MELMEGRKSDRIFLSGAGWTGAFYHMILDTDHYLDLGNNNSVGVEDGRGRLGYYFPVGTGGWATLKRELPDDVHFPPGTK